ncbi:MAG: LamG-like jellyroll fold domain-containing protein [Planctomycetota bacterium]|jgi:hypothetical protein
MKIVLILMSLFFAVSVHGQGHIMESVEANPPEGLIMGLTFNDGGITDWSFTQTNGTLNGPSFTTGPYGGAYTFNGTTDFIDMGNGSELNPVSSTFMAWGSCKSVASAARWLIARDDNALGRSFSFGLGTSKQALQINGAATITGQGAVLVNNVWYHYVSRGDPTVQWKSFLNGVLNGTGVWSAPNSTTGSTTVGKRTYAGSTWVWDGDIAAAFMFNRALSDSEIVYWYEKGEAL